MADAIKLGGKDDGQSIPPALAAPVTKKSRVKATKAAAPAPDASVVPAEATAVTQASPLATPEPVAPEPAAPEPAGPEPILHAVPAAESLPEPVAATAAAEPEPVVVPEPAAEDVEAAPVSSPPAAAPAEPQPQKESIMATTIENVNTAATANTEKAQAMFADVNDRAKGAMAKSAKLFEDATAFGKGNVEALVESSKIAAKGFETMGQDAAEFGRKQFEEATAAFKTLASVKSPTEFLKLHGDFVRQSFDSLVAETSRSTEQALKLAGEVVQPISNRIAVAAEKMKTAA